MTDARLQLTAYPRLHLGLIDCGNATARMFGGVGVTLDGPPTILNVCAAEFFRLSAAKGIDRRAQRETLDLARRFERKAPLPKINLHISTMPPPHVGLGTKTTLLLATARVLQEAARLDLSQDGLVALTRRGGASGVGVHAFFAGGWIADAGHPRHPTQKLIPSSAARPRSRPPIVFRHPVRDDWRFYLLLPSGVRRSGAAEQAFFDAHTPISTRSVLNTIGIVYHGLLPAIVDEDLRSLREAMALMQRTGFKEHEIKAQPHSVRRCIQDLHNAGFASGMSSMGPLVFGISERGRDAVAVDIAERHGAHFIGAFAGRNFGSELETLS